MLKDNGDKIPDDKKTEVEAANNELKEALERHRHRRRHQGGHREIISQVVQDASPGDLQRRRKH